VKPVEVPEMVSHGELNRCSGPGLKGRLTGAPSVPSGPSQRFSCPADAASAISI